MKLLKSKKLIVAFVVLALATGLVFIQSRGCENTASYSDVCVDEYIGLTLDKATATAEENELSVRIVEVDGEFRVITDDFNLNRINFKINDSIVTNADLY